LPRFCAVCPMYRSVIIVDDFYDHPDQVRRAALSLAYPPREGPLTFPGRNSQRKVEPPGMTQAISSIVGEPLTPAKGEGAFHCHFRITLAGEPSRYKVHVDPNRLAWVGVIYLSQPTDCRGGTAFFRHRGLASDRTPTDAAELAALGVSSLAELLRRDGNDAAAWDEVMTLPMRFNRAVLYRPWLWHSAGEAFGDQLENGRLIQLLAFEPAMAAAPA